MADEHKNSAEQKPEAGPPAKEPKGGSKVLRIIIWGLVGVFVVVALLDIASRKGYEKTLANLEAGIDEAEEPVTLDDFETEYKSGLAIKMKGNKGGQSTILYKWPSLIPVVREGRVILRQYEIHLTLKPGDEQLLATYSTNDDDNAALIARPGVQVDDSELEEGAAPGAPGENQAAPGEGRGRRQRPEGDEGEEEENNPAQKPAEENENPDEQN